MKMGSETSEVFQRYYWVEPGRLAAGVYPGARVDETARKQVFDLLDAGVNTFIDLTHPDDGMRRYMPILKERPEIVVERYEFPILDITAPTERLMVEILNRVDEVLNRGRVVYIHCIGGRGRTGAVVGCYLVRHGRTGEEALQEIRNLRKWMPEYDRTKKSPEVASQEELVRNWGREWK